MTNSAGRSYARSGDIYNEIAGTAGEGAVKFTDRQFGVTYTVKMYKLGALDAHVEPTASDLAGIPGTYTFQLDPSTYVKLSQTQTTTLGAINTANNPLDDTAATGTALGATAGAVLDISETIEITSAGAVSFGGQSKTTAQMLAGVTFTVYGGLQVNSQEAQPFSDADSNPENDIESIYDGSKIEVAVGKGTGNDFVPLS